MRDFARMDCFVEYQRDCHVPIVKEKAEERIVGLLERMSVGRRWRLVEVRHQDATGCS